MILFFIFNSKSLIHSSIYNYSLEEKMRINKICSIAKKRLVIRAGAYEKENLPDIAGSRPAISKSTFSNENSKKILPYSNHRSSSVQSLVVPITNCEPRKNETHLNVPDKKFK
jgi:hypothetical protein